MGKPARSLTAVALAIYLAIPCTSWAASTAASQLAISAKEALDAHYGRPEKLTAAASLLARAMSEDKENASVYVEAARLTIKGGHVVATTFQPGTVDAYGELIDKALSLDPGNAKAHILKAEYFHIKADYASEQVELDKAKQTGTNDSWLLVGYARLYRRLGDAERALSYYTEARTRGPGATLEQRNAYVAALNGLATLAARSGDEKTLRELISETRSGRDPRDAWALGNLAASLVGAGMFDEAITLSRETLQVMSHGAARLTLAAALFGKAAQLASAGKESAAAPLLAEAKSFGYSGSSVLSRFHFGTAKVSALRPRLEALLQ